MAMSFHNGNVVAMGMHLEGDNASARRLIRVLKLNEAQYLHLARRSGDEKRADLLQNVSDETDGVESHF